MTLASVRHQRVGPTRLVEGEGICPGGGPCRITVLGGGFPAPYLVDRPAASARDRLGFLEDELRWRALAADLAFWLALCWGAVRFAPWRGRERGSPDPGTTSGPI